LGITSKFSEAMGKIFRNLEDPKWYTAETQKQVISMAVISPLGHRAVAYLRYHFYDGKEHIGDAYHCKDGHEYLRINQKVYTYNPDTDSFAVRDV